MKRFELTLLLCAVMAPGVHADLPVTDGLIVHLHADSLVDLQDGDPVTTWIDSAQEDAVDGTVGDIGSGTPEFKTDVLFGKPVVRFNGAEGLSSAQFAISTRAGATVLMVCTGDQSGALHERMGHFGAYDAAGGVSISMDVCTDPANQEGSGFRLNNGWSLVGNPNPMTTGWHVGVWQASQGTLQSQLVYYVDGVRYALAQNNPGNTVAFPSIGNVVAVGNGHGPGGAFYSGDYVTGDLAVMIVYNRVLTEDEVGTMSDYLMATYLGVQMEIAVDPVPESGQTQVHPDVVLSWQPGKYAASHNVYLGTSFDAVNDADTDSTFLVSRGQTATTYDTGTQELDRIYYWRVDEISAPPDLTVFKGNVWSFTVEPVGLPVESVTATASASLPGMAPSNTVDGSGLNELDQHSVAGTDMWLSGPSTEPVWLHYEFDKAYKLHEMQVWNANQIIEPFFGLGVKEVSIETSTDGTTWTALYGVPPLAQGTGLNNYTANTTVNFGGAVAKYVKMTMISAHGQSGQFSLSEVRFLAIPTYPRELTPTQSVTTASADVTLDWQAGREAVSHQVYLGTIPDDLALAGTTQASSFVADDLDYDQTYHWQVVEINESQAPTTYTSEIQSFNTPVYGTVDDVESYSGEEGQEIFITWLDGYGGDASLGGSTTGHIDAPFVETGIVYDGAQSMPFYYANDGSFVDIDGKMGAPTFSEVVRQFDSPQDWTVSRIQSLSIMFSGTPGNTGQLYCKIGDTKILYDGAATDLALIGWQAWHIDLSTLGGLTQVSSLSIGVEGAGTAGLLYLDAMRLYPAMGQTITPIQPSTDGLVVHYAFDGDATDSMGQNPGTLMGTHFFVAGKIGQALQLVGGDSYVAINNLFYDSNGFTEVSVAAWINTVDSGNQIVATFDRNEYWRIEINGDGAGPGQVGWDVMTDAGQLDYGSNTRVDDGEWHHIAGVFDHGTSTIYIDGNLESSTALGSTFGSGNIRYGFVGVGSEAIVFDGAKNPSPYYYIGNVDDVYIYHRALSAAEIVALAGRIADIHKPF